MHMHFFKGYTGVPDPVNANDALDGEIPLRAYQHCEPFLAANRVGYLLNPPVDFTLIWNGTEIFVQIEDIDETLKLDKCFLPGFADFWEENAPLDLLELMPPFLEAFPERGLIQAWTGFYVTTQEGFSTWIRNPVNRNHSSAYQIVEGIVETDWWLGMLFTNIQLMKTDAPVVFRRSTPWLQVFEVSRNLHSKKRAETVCLTSELQAFPPDILGKMRVTSDRRNTAPPGSYRTEARRRKS